MAPTGFRINIMKKHISNATACGMITIKVLFQKDLKLGRKTEPVYENIIL